MDNISKTPSIQYILEALQLGCQRAYHWSWSKQKTLSICGRVGQLQWLYDQSTSSKPNSIQMYHKAYNIGLFKWLQSVAIKNFSRDPVNIRSQSKIPMSSGGFPMVSRLFSLNINSSLRAKHLSVTCYYEARTQSLCGLDIGNLNMV